MKEDKVVYEEAERIMSKFSEEHGESRDYTGILVGRYLMQAAKGNGDSECYANIEEACRWFMRDKNKYNNPWIDQAIERVLEERGFVFDREAWEAVIRGGEDYQFELGVGIKLLMGDGRDWVLERKESFKPLGEHVSLVGGHEAFSILDEEAESRGLYDDREFVKAAFSFIQSVAGESDPHIPYLATYAPSLIDKEALEEKMMVSSWLYSITSVWQLGSMQETASEDLIRFLEEQMAAADARGDDRIYRPSKEILSQVQSAMLTCTDVKIQDRINVVWDKIVMSASVEERDRLLGEWFEKGSYVEGKTLVSRVINEGGKLPPENWEKCLIYSQGTDATVITSRRLIKMGKISDIPGEFLSYLANEEMEGFFKEYAEAGGDFERLVPSDKLNPAGEKVQLSEILPDGIKALYNYKKAASRKMEKVGVEEMESEVDLE